MIEFKLPDMSCGHCVGAVTKALQQIDPQANVAVDLGSRTVQVTSSAVAQALRDALTEAGYPPA